MLILDRTLTNLIKLTLVSAIIFLLFYATSLVLDVKIKEKSYVSQKTLNGRGTSEIKAIPDVANFIFTIKKLKKTLNESQQEMQEIAKKSLEVLEKNGVNKSDIKTINYTTYPEYDRTSLPCDKWGCPPVKEVLKGFVALQSYSVKVRDISKATQIINQLTKAGVDEVGSLNFIIDSIENIKYQARMKAIIKAKSEAEATAKSLNVKLKKIVKYHDEENYYQPYAMHRMSVMADQGSSAKGSYPEIQPGEEVVRSSVVVTFEFE